MVVALSVASAGCRAPRVADQAGRAGGFSFDTVLENAERLASLRYADDPEMLPQVLNDLDYDEYRLIRVQPDKAIWAGGGLPFQLEFFHRGYLFHRQVGINLVEGGRVVPVPFSADLFRYDGILRADQVPPGIGFAGVRVRYPLERPDRYDEVISFLGASYFRALGRRQVYGASCRGLGIDTALAAKEEFPYFKEFWIEQPSRKASSLIMYALLDSPSVTGAYRFKVRPGEDTVVEVQADVFARRAVRQPGIAPLTSMFLFDANNAHRFNDFRPEVHDSDGLLLVNGDGERIWRPLQNPDRMSICRFGLNHLRGFGLLQRERRFDRYLDHEARYDQRPSIWVEPIGDWGQGNVELVEFPSRSEGCDNVAAFWISPDSFSAGGSRRLSYYLHFCTTCPAGETGGKTVATRWQPRKDGVQFHIEFAGKSLADVQGGPPEAVVTATDGVVKGTVVSRADDKAAWLVTFEVVPDGTAPVELRAFLRRGRDALTETWSYSWRPEK